MPSPAGTPPPPQPIPVSCKSCASFKSNLDISLGDLQCFSVCSECWNLLESCVGWGRRTHGIFTVCFPERPQTHILSTWEGDSSCISSLKTSMCFGDAFLEDENTFSLLSTRIGWCSAARRHSVTMWGPPEGSSPAPARPAKGRAS